MPQGKDTSMNNSLLNVPTRTAHFSGWRIIYPIKESMFDKLRSTNKQQQRERLEMKTIRINTTARLAGITIALALFAGVAAEVKAGGDGKGAIRLLELGRRAQSAPAPAVSEFKEMACPKCKDILTTQPDVTSRGLGARSLVAGGVPTQTVARHLCDGCGVDWTISGHGKAKVAVANHKCTSCGAESLACCNMTKGSPVATKGMDKKFEIAPLK